MMKAKTSAALDHAEDPAETLDYSYEKQRELLGNVKSGIADIVTSKKRIQNQEEALRAQAATLDGQARQALQRATRSSRGRHWCASRRSRTSSARSISRSPSSNVSSSS